MGRNAAQRLLADLKEVTDVKTQCTCLEKIPALGFKKIHSSGQLHEQYATIVCDFFVKYEDDLSKAAGSVIFAWVKYLTSSEGELDEPFLPELLKASLKAYSKFSRRRDVHALPALTRCRNILCVVFGVAPQCSYELGFQAVKQVGLHVRRALMSRQAGHGLTKLVSWRLINTLRLWTEAATTLEDTPLTKLTFPLTELMLGVLRAMPPSLSHAPAVLHLVALLNRLAKATNTFIPVQTSLMGLLDLPELRRKPKTMTGDRAALADMSHLVALSKKDLGSAMVLDTIVKDAVHLLVDSMAVQAHRAAFPELTYAVIPKTRRTARLMGEHGYTRRYGDQLTQAAAALAQHGEWMAAERDNAEISPRDPKLTEFETDHVGKGPLVKTLAKLMKGRDAERRVRLETEVILNSDEEEEEEEMSGEEPEEDEEALRNTVRGLLKSEEKDRQAPKERKVEPGKRKRRVELDGEDEIEDMDVADLE